MERDKAAALRRVAIVLSSLPDATARRLLSSLEGDHQRAVRAALNHLEDVDPLERRRALDGFSTSIRHGRSSVAGQNDAAEIVLSRVALQRDDSRLSDRSTGEMMNQSSPLAFLSSVDDDAIAHRIKEEHPQTVAIVLASISPRQAARLLAKLGVALRAETMRRLAKMDTPPPEVIEEIASQLKQKLVHAAPGPGGFMQSGSLGGTNTADGYPVDKSRSAGQAALQAILAEMNQATQDPHNTAATYAPGRAMHGTASDPAAGRYENSRPPSMMGSGDEAYRSGGIRLHNDSDPMRQSRESSAAAFSSGHGADSQPDLEQPDGRPEMSSAKSTAEIHSQLISTPPAKLREALASVDGRQALLALCGLPTATADAVLSDLPRRQAKQIRRQIASLGMVELREIDAAKEAVARSIRPVENRAAARPTSNAGAAQFATLAAA